MTQYIWKFQELNTLNYGSAHATHDVTLIINLGCPDSRAWYLKNEPLLFGKVANGNIQLHIKLWDKPVDDLKNGGIADQYIDYHQPQQARDLIHNIFTDQAKLNQLSPAQVGPYLAQTYGLTQANASASKLTANEVASARITNLPSIIVDNQFQPEEKFDLSAL
ncbi:hypothetical protein N692_11635 [Lactiplantibacillus plantarum EGD-AQ4]|nr:hypothetical protein N692_11635 [Lactiplantibacillus plantarum EGD-AQ4]